jgi:hypothetical protein
VHGFNHKTNQFERLKGSALCDEVVLENNIHIENCDLFIKHQVNASHIGFISLSYNASANLRAHKPKVTENTTI